MTTKTTTPNNNGAPLWVAYYRVSTKRQGLGLDAQRARVEAAAVEAGATIVAEYQEKESGKDCNRPQLNRAMATARRHGAFVVVAKHDRLSRDLAFAADIVLRSGVQFNILNIPFEAMTDPLLFGIYFGLATKEAKLISERTKAALQALRAKGVKLGRPDAAHSITPEMVAAASAARTRKAEDNPNNQSSANEIRRYLSTGAKCTLQAIADHLDANGYLTARGNKHNPQSVTILCRRYNINLK